MYQFSLIKQTKLMGMGDNTVVASNKHKFMKIFVRYSAPIWPKYFTSDAEQSLHYQNGSFPVEDSAMAKLLNSSEQ